MGVTTRALSRPWRTVLAVAAIAVAHATLTILLILVVFVSGMTRFETGAPDEPVLVSIAASALSVVGFPLASLLTSDWLTPEWRKLLVNGFPWDHLLFLANGVLWGLAFVWMHRIWRRRKQHV